MTRPFARYTAVLPELRDGRAPISRARGRKGSTHFFGSSSGPSRGASSTISSPMVVFRRSQTIAYRPACENCRSWPAREPAFPCVCRVADFKPSANSCEAHTHQMPHLVGEVRRKLRPRRSNMRCCSPPRYLAAIPRRWRDDGYVDARLRDVIADSHINTMVVEYRARGGRIRAYGRGAGPLLGMCLRMCVGGLSMVYSFSSPWPASQARQTYLTSSIGGPRPRMGSWLRPLGYWVQGSAQNGLKAFHAAR